MNREPVSALLKKADKLCKEDRYDEAIDVYKEIIEMDANCYDAYYGLSWTYGCKEIKGGSNNRYAKEHVALYEKLEQIDPNFDSYQVLAGSLADAKRYEEALRYYDKAIKYDKRQLGNDPSHVDWLDENYKEKAKILFKLKMYTEAIELYDKTIEESIKKNSNDKFCSELYAAKREVYCILDDNAMVVEMDKKFSKADDLWREHEQSGEYDKTLTDKFKNIAKSFKPALERKEKLRKDLSEVVLDSLKLCSDMALSKNKIRTINEVIDRVLEEVDYEKDLRFIEKAYVAKIVNDALRSQIGKESKK